MTNTKFEIFRKLKQDQGTILDTRVLSNSEHQEQYAILESKNGYIAGILDREGMYNGKQSYFGLFQTIIIFGYILILLFSPQAGDCLTGFNENFDYVHLGFTSILVTADDFLSSVETLVIGRPLTGWERFGIVAMGLMFYLASTYPKPPGDPLLPLNPPINPVPTFPHTGQETIINNSNITQDIVSNVVDTINTSGSGATAALLGTAAAVATVASSQNSSEFLRIFLDFFNAEVINTTGLMEDLDKLFEIGKKNKHMLPGYKLESSLGFLDEITRKNPKLFLKLFARFTSPSHQNTLTLIKTAYKLAYDREF